MTLFSTPVICIGPETWPQTINESLMFFNMRLAKGAPLVVGGERSTTLRRRFDTVPERVERDSEEGSMMCAPVWLDTVMPVPFSFASLLEASLDASADASSCASASASLFSSLGLNLSNGVG